MNYRLSLLNELVNFSRDLSSVQKELSLLPWDYSGIPFQVTKAHICNILSRYLSDDLNEKDIELWANLLEGREDIDYVEECETLIENIIFRLANPVIEGTLSHELALQIVDSLSKCDR
ncbi:MAG: hypothetical protein KME12_26835 [Trichocoleus desertorum ATA4-8-CV12]|jgi:hypothetical protein|nr:hypothetical protein [Trichocoleus desertorum ATA4-8-CV12]